MIGAWIEGMQCRSHECTVSRLASSMTFRIQTASRGRLTVLILSGRFETQAIGELSGLLELQTDYRDVVLDLKEVSVISRDAMRFFVRCESEGVTLENCAPYIREWMEGEKD
jgi:hypothetical protein